MPEETNKSKIAEEIAWERMLELKAQACYNYEKYSEEAMAYSAFKEREFYRAKTSWINAFSYLYAADTSVIS